MSTNNKFNNMRWLLNTHYAKDIDLTWAIGLQMENKLTRAEVEGIILTHQFNSI